MIPQKIRQLRISPRALGGFSPLVGVSYLAMSTWTENSQQFLIRVAGGQTQPFTSFFFHFMFLCLTSLKGFISPPGPGRVRSYRWRKPVCLLSSVALLTSFSIDSRCVSPVGPLRTDARAPF